MNATASPSSGTFPYAPLSMNRANPPLQSIFVGFESNQHGQAASQEHASSSWPDTFQGVVFSSVALAGAARRRTSAVAVEKVNGKRIGILLRLRQILAPN